MSNPASLSTVRLSNGSVLQSHVEAPENAILNPVHDAAAVRVSHNGDFIAVLRRLTPEG